MDVQKTRKDIIAMMDDNPDVALERTNKLVNEMPGEIWTLQLRASVYENRGEIEKALADIDTVIIIQPDEPSPYFKKAYIYVGVKKYKEAIIEFSRSIDIGKKLDYLYFDNHSHFMRAFCFCKIGDFDSAKLDLKTVDADTRTWIDRLWTKDDLVEVCRNKRMS
jgi:tetratricopeptide (TPR) repeat protein